MSNAATESNSNPIGILERSNLTVSSVQLNCLGKGSTQAIVISQFSMIRRAPLEEELSRLFLWMAAL